MIPSSRTPEGQPNRCHVCGHEVRIEPSTPPGDATCPSCGSLLWFNERPLSQCFIPDGTTHVIKATTKREAIEEMVGVLVSSDRLSAEHEGSVVDAIMGREELGSTGIGRGVAVPHAKHAGVAEPTGLVGQSKPGVDFHSLDGEPVYTIFMLISPPDRSVDHLRMLEAVSRMARDYRFPRL